jgi:hypothetical protein
MPKAYSGDLGVRPWARPTADQGTSIPSALHSEW